MQESGAATQISTNAEVAALPPPVEQTEQSQNEPPNEPSIISSFSMSVNQTIFAGNLECLTATSIHDHPRSYLGILVAQNDIIVGLFLFDSIVETKVQRLSLNLSEAIDAIAIDSSTANFVSFDPAGNSFSLNSVSESGESSTFKFVCANALAFDSWCFHLSVHDHDKRSSGAPRGDASALQELRDMSEQLGRSSEIARATLQKLSSTENAYK
jgi:hypothetical protein